MKDKFGSEFSVDNYNEVMRDMYDRLSVGQFKKPGTSYKALAQHLSISIHNAFSL